MVIWFFWPYSRALKNNQFSQRRKERKDRTAVTIIITKNNLGALCVLAQISVNPIHTVHSYTDPTNH
jgi:hypothetical protein